MSIKIFISVGDPSADIHTSNLMKSLKERLQDVEFYGIGGDEMIAEGLIPVIHLKEVGVVGFWEVAKKYLFFRKLFSRCINFIKKKGIKYIILVDYPGFNIPLAKAAKSLGLKVIYYIAPQLWAWGKSRGEKLKHNVDKLLVVFPFEQDFFSKMGINTVFVGHPILDNPKFNGIVNDGMSREKVVAFLPGSRKQELIKHLPIVEQTIEILRGELSDFSFKIGKARDIEIGLYRQFIRENSNIEIVGDAVELMKSSYVGAIKTGTSNLEAIFCELPFVMFYRTSMLSYLLGKKLINLQTLSIANILSNKEIVCEHIQNEATPKNISRSIMDLIRNKEKYLAIVEEFKRIKRELFQRGASDRAGQEIIDVILNEN